MKRFLQGAGGTLLVLILAAMIIPLYADYRARAETNAWLVQVAPAQRALEQSALRQKSLVNIGLGLNRRDFLPAKATVFEIKSNGEIWIGGGRDGQLLVMIPSLVQDKVLWRCLGGPAKAMPDKCKIQ